MRNDILQQAREREAAIQVAVFFLPDDVAVTLPSSLYHKWSGDAVEYVFNDLRLHNGALYRCRGDHISNADNDPVNAPSLWRKLEWVNHN